MDVLAYEQAALACQLEEISLFDSEAKGKHRADEPPDFVVAMELLRESFEENMRILRDAMMAKSIALALETDEAVIIETATEEEQAAQDRRIALGVDGDNIDSPDPPPYRETDGINNVIPELVEATEFHRASAISYAGPSTQTSTFQVAQDATSKATCCTCLESMDDEKHLKLQCGDRYHFGCLKELFTRATKDPGLFPPRCCRIPIPLASVAQTMSSAERARFHEAEEEFSTVNRLYCSNQECGKFISKRHIVADQGNCPHCGQVSCLHCKGPAHAKDCPVDESLQATLALAQDQGWRRCGRCSAVVELDTGCYHITCRCGSEFCYLCGETWKTCRCDSWEERHLLHRAEVIVDREALRPLPPPARQQLVQNMQQELLEVHDCRHPGKFERIFNTARRGVCCEMCSDRHWKYILRCRRCHVQVCEDCRRHRV